MVFVRGKARFSWRQVCVHFAGSKFFVFNCGNSSVQVDGVLMICYVETEQYSGYFD